jgi:transposase-like protein
MLGGNNAIDKIYESKFGKRKYPRGHYVEFVWVLGLVENSNQKQIELITFNNRSKDSLISLIKRFVRQDTIIYTDGWRGYIGLSDYFTDYKIVVIKNTLLILIRVFILT